MNVIQIENLWKEYQLGVIGHGTLTHDLQSWWARVRGKDDPNSKHAPMLKKKNKQMDANSFWALQDININVQQGEILGIIGKNGAGKSTLLKILSRVTAPSSGQIKIKGRIASLLEVGTGFHPELTGRENIYLNGAVLGMSKHEIRSKIDEIINFSGVSAFIDTPVKRYSSGMYVRLAFAVAAHLEPEILVVDEVLAVGDAEFQQKCLGKMGEVANSGRTILFVSHNMSAVQNLCSRCCLLDEGNVVIAGQTKDVVNSYLNSRKTAIKKNLIVRTDRTGKGHISFTKFELFDSKRQLIEKCTTGDKVWLRAHYSFNVTGQMNCRFSLNIMNNVGCLILLDSLVLAGKQLTVTMSGCVEFFIDELPLSKGNYFVGLFVESQDAIQDWIEYGAHLRVEDGDYFNTGKQYPKGWDGKTVLVRGKVNLVEASLDI